LALIQRFSTAAAPPLKRLSFWNDICMGAYGATVVDADPVGFQGLLTTLQADRLQIASVKSTPAICCNSIGSRRNAADETAFSLQLVHSGRCRIKHAGFQTFGMPGDMLLVDNNKSYDLAFNVPVQGLVLSPPWPRFSAYSEKFEALAGQSINVASGPGAVLSSFIRSAWDHLVDTNDEEWPQSATDIVWDLLECVLQGERTLATVAARPDRVRRIASALVNESFMDSAFQSSGIAAALGVSARYLQMAFAEVGTTPSRFLLARRLDAVAARLTRLDAPVRITDVALECGFNDLSHFSRAFHRRFGISARDFRQSFGGKATDRQ
jgi:AraC-like DNA-binding protein